MTPTERSWADLDRHEAVLFAEDAEELERLLESAGRFLKCTPTSDWADVMKVVSATRVTALVVRASGADEAMERLDQAAEVAPHLLRLVVVDEAAVPELLAVQNRGLVEHTIPAPIRGQELEWALRTALIRYATAQSGRELVEALRKDRASARRKADALQSDLVDAERRLSRIAPTDGLTGLYNRRHLMDQWRREVARARRYELPLSVIVLEPRSGGGLQDDHLRDVGTFLVAAIRDVDFVARASERRFAVVLPHCPGADARSLGKRLLERFAEEHELELFAGTASLREDGDDPAEVFAGAERALEDASGG